MKTESQPRGIQSIEIGYRVLVAIQAGPHPATLRTIADRAGLTSSAAHNYLTSFIRTGMVVIEGRGHYRLGPSIASLGLTALRQFDAFGTVCEEATALSDRTGRGVAVSTWQEDLGPVIIFHKEGSNRGAFDLRNGPVSPLHTGGGNIFIAYLNPAATLAVVRKEARGEGMDSRSADKVHADIRRRVREAGFASCELTELPGYAAISAAIWDSADAPRYALTITGPLALIDPSPSGQQVQALRASAQRLSHQLGAPSRRWGDPVEN